MSPTQKSHVTNICLLCKDLYPARNYRSTQPRARNLGKDNKHATTDARKYKDQSTRLLNTRFCLLFQLLVSLTTMSSDSDDCSDGNELSTTMPTLARSMTLFSHETAANTNTAANTAANTVQVPSSASNSSSASNNSTAATSRFRFDFGSREGDQSIDGGPGTYPEADGSWKIPKDDGTWKIPVPRQAETQVKVAAKPASWISDDYNLPPKSFQWYACVNRSSSGVTGRIAPTQTLALRIQGACGPFGGFDDIGDAHRFLLQHGVDTNNIVAGKFDKHCDLIFEKMRLDC